MVPVTAGANTMVSPIPVASILSRNDPGPLSFVVVTVKTAPFDVMTRVRKAAARNETKENVFILGT
jgi:hypothetical protein